MMKTTLSIDGMSCEHCVNHVKEALEEIPGVVSAAVSLGDKNALVEHGDSVSLDALRGAVSEAGYEAV
ncbi:MAG: cation transporter [Spirochaetaceae bacterium]|jgi:copper chaperone CopZ|nr:cation transporter [Spirochaetaceae bacterium]